MNDVLNQIKRQNTNALAKKEKTTKEEKSEYQIDKITNQIGLKIQRGGY